MRRTRQHGWVYVVEDIYLYNKLPLRCKASWQEDEIEGWRKLSTLNLNKSAKMHDARSHPGRCHLCCQATQIRGKRGRNKAKGKNKEFRIDMDIDDELSYPMM